MLVDEIYEYSYIKMYHKGELHTTSPYYSTYETFVKGYYEPAQSGLNDDTIILGCRTMDRFGSSGGWPGSWPADLVYGMCMKGWINTIEVYADNGNWDDILNVDIENILGIDALVEGKILGGGGPKLKVGGL